MTLTHASPAPLWLCLFFPQLPLEAQSSALNTEQPLAIYMEVGRKTRIVTVNIPAAVRGVGTGMGINAALALVPELMLQARSVPLETATVARLARWAGCFTPTVSIGPDNTLWLEIRGSLRLFNGLNALQCEVVKGLRARGHQVHMACAPTARAALWLVRAGWQQSVATLLELRPVLACLGVKQLGWSARRVQVLEQMGLTTVGDCLRMPREGLARRLGPACLRELDEAVGRHPELQRRYVPPARFSAALELPLESTDRVLLLDGFQRLFQQLQQALKTYQASLRGVWCGFVHPDGQATSWHLGLSQAVSADRLPGLLSLRLASANLSAPVVRLTLRAALEPGQVPSGSDLLGQSLQPEGNLSTLLERLRARLGSPAVQGLALRAEHRPEKAWRRVPDPLHDSLAEARGGSFSPVIRPRPVWLLWAPLPLRLMAGQPVWQGVLSLDKGPERIESGWWDGDDVRRDYYRASNARGVTVWIYQDLRSQNWYLQGFFG